MTKKLMFLDVLAVAWLMHRLWRKEEPEPPLFRSAPRPVGGAAGVKSP